MGFIGPKDLSSPECSPQDCAAGLAEGVTSPLSAFRFPLFEFRFSVFAFRFSIFDFLKCYRLRRVNASAISNSSAMASCASSEMLTNSTPTPIPGTQ